MQISSRFTLAVHIFTCIDTFQNEYKVTSDFIAGSTNVNPVIIRKILLQLKAAGLVQVARGTGGTTITRPLSEITFLDIYKAVECVEDNKLFHFHESPNPQCPVGKISTISWMISCSRCRTQWSGSFSLSLWRM